MLPLPVKVYVVAGAIVALGMGYGVWSEHLKSVGARDERIASLTYRGDSLVGVIREDSIQLVKRDTVRLFARIDTGHTIIQHLIDTAIVQHTDTMKITVERLVTIDSTLRACKEGVSECAKLANDRAARIRVLDSLVANLKKSLPSTLSRCGLSVGYGAGYDGKGIRLTPAVIAGCKVWP